MKLSVNAAPLLGKLIGLSTEAKKAFRKASRAGCKTVAAAARAATPRRSGAAQKSIKVRALPRSRRWIGAQVRSGMPARHFSFIELGTKRIQNPAQPMRKAARSTGRAAAESAARAFAETLK